ncbi:MAG: 3-dehydroquinate synthase [Gemmatimonadota bacterium]
MNTLEVGVPATGPGSYRVEIGEGRLDRLGVACRRHLPAIRRLAVVADRNVADHHGGRALEALAAEGIEADLFTFPPGEASKRRSEWARLTDRLLEEGYGRDAGVVALGGGVTGDLAGFVAATYMRGVPVVQVPTSLLAMLDASVGGKTGVDTKRGKNLVGAFHHPVHVLIDPGLLETLPERHLRSGLAEAVKIAAVADASLFEWMEAGSASVREGEPGVLAEIVHRSVALKAEVVEEDPTEEGRRAILNFGHTVGHALELLSSYDVLHGFAVAAGMRVEAALGEVMGRTEAGTADRLGDLLDACGVGEGSGAGTEGVDPEALYAAMRTDKKGRAGTPRCVLLGSVGSVATTEAGGWTHPLPADGATDQLAKALRSG